MIYAFLVGMLIAIGGVCQFPRLIDGGEMALGVSGAGLVAWGLRNWVPVGCQACLGGMLIAGLAAWWHAHDAMARRLPDNIRPVPYTWEGRIDSLPVRFAAGTQTGIRFIFKTQGRRLQIRGVGCAADVRLGENWRLRLVVKGVHGALNAVGFDYEAWALSQSIHGSGTIVCRDRQAAIRIGAAAPYSWSAIRQRVYQQLQIWGQETPYRGIFTALVVGEQSGITPEQWAILRATGTSHLVAISGLHVGLLWGWVVCAMRWLIRLWPLRWQPVDKSRIGAIGGWIAAYGYTQLAGGSIPTQRALWMITVAVCARMGYYRIAPTVGLAQAAIAILLLDPFAVLAPGWWLSCGAVAAIYYSMAGRSGAAPAWRIAVRTTGWTGILMAPMGIGWFQQVAWIGPLANLVVIPVVGIGVVPVLLGGIGIHAIAPGIGVWVWWVADRVWGVVWYGLSGAAAICPATAHHAGWGAVVAATMGLGLLRLPQGFPGRGWAWLYIVPCFWQKPPMPPWGGVWMHVLDVGQGLAVVVETAHHILVYDTGNRWGQQDAGEQVLVPYLRYRGVNRVDQVILSHGDLDHIGGYPALQRQVAITDTMGYGEPLPGIVEPRQCVAGQTWEWDGVRFTCLHPERPHRGRKNNASCVVQVEAGSHRILLTGDIEKAAESQLISHYGARLQSAILLVPHHGSRTSSSLVFLEQVQPQWALVSLGYRNRFRLPHPQVVQRYRQRGIRWWATATHGQIDCALVPGRPITCSAWRIEQPRFWRFSPQPEGTH